MGKGLWIALCALLAACSGDDDATNAWQAGGDAGRTHAFGVRVQTSVNTATALEILRDSVDLLQTPVMLGANVFVAAFADGRLVRIENGAIAWTYRTEDGAPFASRIAVDADGTTYAIDAKARLVCIDAYGAVRWNVTVRDVAERVITSDVVRVAGMVVAAERGGTVIAVDARTGALRWRLQGTPLRVPNICADRNGAVRMVVTGERDTLLCIDRRGQRMAATPLDDVDVTADLIVVGEQAIVAGRAVDTRDGAFGIVRSIAADGATTWNARIGTIPQWCSASGDTVLIVAMEPGAVSSRASRILALGHGGRRLWGVWYDKIITSPLVIGTDAMVCTVTEDAGTRWHDVMVLWRDGRIRRLITCERVPRAMPLPVVAPDGTVILGAADGCSVVRCEEHVIYNILPQ